ncbi:MAG: regulatory protein RecX [Terriglobales bacterium]
MAFGRGKKLDTEAQLYEYAVGALARRMRSVAELKRLLRRRVEPGELGDTLVELIIAKLKEQRYLNDAQYASTYSSLRRENDKFGRRRVITDLKSRGVHSEVIDKAIAGTYENVNEESWHANICAASACPSPPTRSRPRASFARCCAPGSVRGRSSPS